MVLMSPATVLLLDEFLLEPSSEETPEVSEGSGWLGRVINTLICWKGLKNKIVILLGHGLLNLIPSKPRVIKLKLVNKKKHTHLLKC